MTKSNGSSVNAPAQPHAITTLSVAGFKSIVEEQTIEIRLLTLLAGANSSGKSSMMQPLLLLKQAAGEASKHPTSRDCREFLQTVLTMCHRMALTKPIQEEWNRHQSGFARRWRKSMMARKKIEVAEIYPRRSLQKRTSRAAPDAAIAAILEKDRHLIEAALATDQRIVSVDDRVRNHLKDLARSLNELASICWVNPEKTDQMAVSWLQQGAPADKPRMLEYIPPQSTK